MILIKNDFKSVSFPIFFVFENDALLHSYEFLWFNLRVLSFKVSFVSED